ncbi:MAG: hypothetical protein JXM73_08740 [Anaerolineae bacterium]|nr:hypothetical protein [Anaerolineae bacterium]
MIPDGDLEDLKSFESDGPLVLSVYMPLDTPQSRKSAHDEFLRQVEIQLAKYQADPDCREAVKEDIEIIGLYLKTNGHRRHAGLAIFSCAPKFFWRAYPLPVAVPLQIATGRKFDVKPLIRLPATGSSR